MCSTSGEEIAVTATTGIAIAARHHNPQTLIRDAEAAMHRAKNARGRYELYDNEMHERNIGRLRTENALRRAHRSRELYLAYQPLIALSTGEIAGYEGLLRWNHAEWGPVAPIEFIPIAEESGLIIPIGRQVLRDASDQLVQWRDQHRPALPVAVNISSRQLFDDALPEFIAETLARAEISPSCSPSN